MLPEPPLPELHQAIRAMLLAACAQVRQTVNTAMVQTLGCKEKSHISKLDAKDFFRDPYVLEFLGAPAVPALYEKDLEQGLCVCGAAKACAGGGRRLLHRLGFLQLPAQVLCAGGLEGGQAGAPRRGANGHVCAGVRRTTPPRKRQPDARFDSLLRAQRGGLASGVGAGQGFVGNQKGKKHMKIKSVTIKNYRALKNVSIPFDSVTTFIGPNGVGKSTVLKALDWFFNGKPSVLTEEDCSFGLTNEQIEVEVTFDQLTDRDRNELGKYVPQDVQTFTAWKTRGIDGAEILSANAKSYSEFNRVKTAPTATEKKALYAQLRSDRADLALPQATTAVLIDEALRAWEVVNINLLENTPETLTNFFGFNGSAKMSGLFDFVLVSADLRASEESVDGKASVIGRILEQFVDRTTADIEIVKIVEESRLRQQEIYRQKFVEPLENISKKLNEILSEYAPGRLIKVSPSDVQLKAPRTTFEVAVLDGASTTAVDRQGHGFQRTLLISALQQLAQASTSGEAGVICLAIEEPELFQHPIQAQTFAKILRSLAEDANKNFQVTYATHSPYFLEASHFNQIRRMTRSDGDYPEVKVNFTTVENLKDKLNGIVSPATVEKQIDGILQNELAIAMFANRALIVEGTTDAAILFGISDKERPGKLEAFGIAIVPARGKSSIPITHAVLTSFGIPVYALADGDAGFEAKAIAKGKNQSDIQSERNSHIAANRTLLKFFNANEEDFPSESINTEFAIFKDCLESFIEEKWPEWGQACKKFETETNILLRKNHNNYRRVTFYAGGVVPQFLQDVLTKARGEAIQAP